MNILLNPYLHFDGNCEEAMNFYKSVLGGELTLSKFGDIPENGEDPAKIMHSELKTDSFSVMASDGGKQPMNSKSFSLSLNGEDGETLRKYFDGLADGGKVTMPVAKQPWGAEFGMLQDKFGVDWMVNITSVKK